MIRTFSCVKVLKMPCIKILNLVLSWNGDYLGHLVYLEVMRLSRLFDACNFMFLEFLYYFVGCTLVLLHVCINVLGCVKVVFIVG
jgi:hypothetical protein